jgi:uncharacterized damage-inducible protein DinB
MTSEQASFLLNAVYMPQIQNEYKTTRRVIEAVPADKTGWKPDPKSMGALELAAHIAGSDCAFLHGIASGKFDFAADGTPPESAKTPAELLKWYDEVFTKGCQRLAATKPEDLARTLDFHGVWTMPAVSFAGVMLSHSIHHRGQLSTYLRPMGSKVPSIYGGSADEPMQMPAQA